MNNQYSRGCGYNYRRSPQRDMNPASSTPCSCMPEQDRIPPVCTPTQPRSDTACCPIQSRSATPCCAQPVSMKKPLAMGYVPMQEWRDLYPICKGLQVGTIFAELCKPFCGKGGACR